jgi:hypothetical protein
MEGREIANKLLLSLSAGAFDLARPHLEFIELPLRFELRRPEEPAQFAYFLNAGITSLIIQTEQGETAEVGVAGREGMACASFAVGLRRSPLKEMIQLAGNGLRVSFAKLQELVETNAELRGVVVRYAVLQGMEIAQIAGCNRLHSGEQRLARWLLMVQDRQRRCYTRDPRVSVHSPSSNPAKRIDYRFRAAEEGRNQVCAWKHSHCEPKEATSGSV